MARFPGAPDGPFGFHIQQAVEKLLKSLLSQLGVEYRTTHDLDYLVSLLESAGEILPQTVITLSRIQRFAVIHRYDDVPEFAALDRPESIETVRLLRAHVEARIAVLSAAP